MKNHLKMKLQFNIKKAEPQITMSRINSDKSKVNLLLFHRSIVIYVINVADIYFNITIKQLIYMFMTKLKTIY